MKILHSIDKNFIFKGTKFNNDNQVVVIFFDNNFNEIKNKINSNNLFDFNINYIVHNCTFLENLNDESISFIRDINNNNNNIILTNESKKIDIEKIKRIDNIEILFFPELNLFNMRKYIDCLLEEYKINIFDKNFLYSLFTPNSSLIDQEIKKIGLLFEKNINNLIIEKVIFEYSKENIFDLIFYLLNKDYINLFLILDNLLFKGYKVENIITIMSNQIFNLKNYISIFEKEKNLYSIHKKLNLEEYKIKKFYTIINSKGLCEINSILLLLYNVEINIKKKQHISCFEIKKFFMEV